MYTPPSFQVSDSAQIYAFVKQHSFGLLLTTDGNTIHDTHTPFLLADDNTLLLGHIAKANPHWKTWDSATTAKALFTGPHAYISPSYYISEFNVPTWNYTAVSVSGPLSIIHEQKQVLTFINLLVAQHEEANSVPWSLNSSDKRYLQLLDSIVVFQLEISEIEATFKLNQNKSSKDQQSVIHHLATSATSTENEVASLMQNSKPNSIPH